MIKDNYNDIKDYIKSNIKHCVLNTNSVNNKFKYLNDRYNNIFIGGIQEYNYYEILIYLSDKDKNSINHKLYISKEYNIVYERIKGKGEFKKYE